MKKVRLFYSIKSNFNIFVFSLVLCVALFSSCSKDEDIKTNSSSLTTTPTALAINDNSSAGVYKGIVVGSTGYFQVKVKNGDDSITCKLVFDNISLNLTTTSLSKWSSRQPIKNAVFSGMLNSQSVSLTFSCDSDGSNPVAVIDIPGHTTYVSIVKEKSNMLVECFEGSYIQHSSSGDVSGIWNFVSYGENVDGWHVNSLGRDHAKFTGTISNSRLIIDTDKLLTIGKDLLYFNNNLLSGTAVSCIGETINVTGTRVW
ncbi:MAG: hypothetical protein P4L28_04705 [Paludibacteraceae bacterium]|nr:hypothetical protein [Paludibacteraceae bacterium]